MGVLQSFAMKHWWRCEKPISKDARNQKKTCFTREKSLIESRLLSTGDAI